MSDTKAKIINGLSFEISQPYAEGHVINAAEAKTLNQVRSENIGNNLRDFVKKAQEAGKTDELAAAVAKYDAEYVFTLASASARKTLDPVERKARAMAKDVIKAKLAELGRKLTDIPAGLTKEEWEEKLEANIEKVANSDAVLKAAKKAVDDEKKRTEGLAAELDLG
jgi:hypothetical protein